MELTHLRYFLNVARTRSFTAGARASHVSPPAISKAVKRLEEELGVSLLTRTTRRAALTDAGEVLFAHCRELFRQVESLRNDLDAHTHTVSGELRIGAMEVFSIYLLPVALCRLVRRHPHLVPLCHETLPENLERRLLEGDLDVVFTVGGGLPGSAVTPLGASPPLLVCGRDHPLYASGRVTGARLTDLPFVVPRFFGHEHLPPIDQYPEDRYPRRVGATIELLQMGLQLTISGSYLGYFPEVSIRQHLAAGALRALRGVKLGPPLELKALTRKGVTPRPAARALIDELRAVMADR